MSISAEHLSLFKADWISDPNSLKALARRHKYNDLFTAELAAWCAEVHEHHHDLEDTVGVELLLMGGNAASLRFEAVQQRGSRDNDYLTAASHADIARLIDAFAERFKALRPLFLPTVYEPERPTVELNMLTYVIPVALLLGHGKAMDNNVKVEFHFEPDLPPAETVTGNVGPTQRSIRALSRSWRMRTPGRCRLSCTTSCGRCSATGTRRLPSESPTHTQRSSAPNPVSIRDGVIGGLAGSRKPPKTRSRRKQKSN